MINYAVWLYYRFPLSHRDVEELLAERGLRVSHETVQCRVSKFGPQYRVLATLAVHHIGPGIPLNAFVSHTDVALPAGST